MIRWAAGLPLILPTSQEIEIGGRMCKVEVIDSSGRRRITAPDGGSHVDVGPTVPDEVLRQMLGNVWQQQQQQQQMQQQEQQQQQMMDEEDDEEGDDDEDEYDESLEDDDDDTWWAEEEATRAAAEEVAATRREVPLSGVTLTWADGGKMKIKEGRGHEDLQAFVVAGGDALGIRWDGTLKLELSVRHTGLRFVNAGEIHIDLTTDERRPLLCKDDADAELADYMAVGRPNELKLILGGHVTDGTARRGLAPFFDSE